jgi:hypothetical protein
VSWAIRAWKRRKKGRKKGKEEREGSGKKLNFLLEMLEQNKGLEQLDLVFGV